MSERTFRLEDLRAARSQWDAGEFSDEWRPWRKLAEEGGVIFPPEGTRWDSWDDDSPSQRAILIRAIRETPDLLRKSIVGARSWGEVVKRLTNGRDDMREDADLRDRDDRWERSDEITPREAVTTLGGIVNRIRESLP